MPQARLPLRRAPRFDVCNKDKMRVCMKSLFSTFLHKKLGENKIGKEKPKHILMRASEKLKI